MSYAIRQITDAFAEAHPTMRNEDQDALKALVHARARNLRDKGKIAATNRGGPGETATYSDADVVAACTALALNLQGIPWGWIEAMNLRLRTVWSATGRPAFENTVDRVKAGEALFLTLKHYTAPWPHTEATLEAAATSETEPESDEKTAIIAVGAEPGLTIVVPVTAVAKPVLDLLERA